MTVIRPNSISGVSSITGSGGDISIFRADGTAADVTVNNITSGVVTATTFSGNVTGNVTGNITGNITGATASFTGDVGVGGTLTYEDVTNIDSVGVITARDGLRVTGIATVTGDVKVGGSVEITNGATFLNKNSVGIGSTTTAGRNAGVSTAIGTLIFNATGNKLEVYNGNAWLGIAIAAALGSSDNPATSAAQLIADGQSADGYYYIKFPGESTAVLRWCDLTNGYMLIAHWSPNSTSGSGDASPTSGTTSYAAGTGGFSGVTAAAVAAPNGSDDEATTQTWVWDADTRGTQTGGSFFRNNTTSNSGTTAPSVHTKGYIPKNYGFEWRYMKWGVRVSAPGGTSAGGASSDNYNSMDNFSPGTGNINIVYVDGLSITHGASATDGGGSGRNHIFTVNVNGTNTNGNNLGSNPSFLSDGNGNNNMASHSGTNTSSYSDLNNTYDKGSASNTRIEMRIQSDQQSANEDLYVRAWYILIK